MTLSRRDLSRYAASAAVIAALRSFQSEAQLQQIPRRLVLFFTPHGTVWNRWRPQNVISSTQFTLSYILEPLQAYLPQVTMIDGVGLIPQGPGAPHTRGPGVLFTGSPLANDGTFRRGPDCTGGCTYGWNSAHSVDQEVANRLKDNTPYKLLPFSVGSGGGFPGAHISYAGPAKPNVARDNPVTAWEQLFGQATTSTSEVQRQTARRLNIMRVVQGDLEAVKGKVSRADLVRLEAHGQALAEIQRSLGTTMNGCASPGKPAGPSTSVPEWKPWALDREIELLATSLACGLSRVGSIQYRPGENDSGPDGMYPWVGKAEHHLSSHDTGASSQAFLADIYRWYASRFAYLLKCLDGFPEAEGSLLDHTLVVWGSEIGEGSTHDSTNIPFVVAGGRRRGVQGGRYLKYPKGTMNNRLLVSLLHYMGFTDVSKFGTVDGGSGGLAGLL